MTVNPDVLHRVAEQAVRDILELDEQVRSGELTHTAAQPMQSHYEQLAGRALSALDRAASDDDAMSGKMIDEDSTEPGHGPWTWSVIYGLAGVLALIAALVLLPDSLVARPAGGFVTGNEVRGSAAANLADPAGAMADRQLEQAVAANPQVVGMRLALADRYVAEGAYEQAMRHYITALRIQPDNAEGLAHLGWLLLQINQPGPAWESVNQALAVDPTLLDALWFKANIALYGRDDPAAALATLTDLRRRNPPPEVVAQVDQLAAVARGRAGGGG